MPEEPAGPWRMFAHRYNDGLLHNLGARWWVEIHGLPEPIVEVEARRVAHDDPAATHWAWLKAGDREPEMIYPRRVLYEVCFPYGPEAEERAGKGRTVRLAVREVEARSQPPA